MKAFIWLSHHPEIMVPLFTLGGVALGLWIADWWVWRKGA